MNSTAHQRSPSFLKDLAGILKDIWKALEQNPDCCGFRLDRRIRRPSGPDCCRP
jgi:hypothetical protein